MRRRDPQIRAGRKRDLRRYASVNTGELIPLKERGDLLCLQDLRWLRRGAAGLESQLSSCRHFEAQEFRLPAALIQASDPIDQRLLQEMVVKDASRGVVRIFKGLRIPFEEL